jgi:hypothetical protein
MSSGLFAQQYDSRLLDSYDAEVLESLAHNDPHKLELLHYAIDHGMYISENGNSKSNQLPEVTWTEDMQSFVDLGLQITDQNQYFQIKNEDKVLVVKSFWVLNNELENK